MSTNQSSKGKGKATVTSDTDRKETCLCFSSQRVSVLQLEESEWSKDRIQPCPEVAAFRPWKRGDGGKGQSFPHRSVAAAGNTPPGARHTAVCVDKSCSGQKYVLAIQRHPKCCQIHSKVSSLDIYCSLHCVKPFVDVICSALGMRLRRNSHKASPRCILDAHNCWFLRKRGIGLRMIHMLSLIHTWLKWQLWWRAGATMG